VGRPYNFVDDDVQRSLASVKTRERLATYRPGGAAAFDVSLESSGAERAAVQGGELLLNPHPVHCTGCWQDGVNQGGRELVLDFHRNESGIHPFHIPLFAMHQGRRCGRSHVKPEDRMQNAVSITQSAGAERAPTSSYKGAAIYLFWGILFTFRGLVHLTGRSSHPSPAFLLVGICLPLIGGLVLCSLGLILLFGMASIGELEYRQISDRGVEQRVRDRYAAELDRLSSIGFSYDFTSGEAMSAARILLIYPAFILWQARANGAVLALGRGPRILLAAPVLSSADGRVFAHPQTRGVTFYTALRKGPLLITKNYDSLSCETSECVIRAWDSTVAEAWQSHKQWVNQVDTDANPAKRDRSYQSYADIARQEDTCLKSQS